MDDAFLPGAGESKLLTLLPAEVLHHILQFLPPADLVLRVPCVCSALHAFIKGNRNLFRQVYLDVLVRETPSRPSRDDDG